MRENSIISNKFFVILMDDKWFFDRSGRKKDLGLKAE